MFTIAPGNDVVECRGCGLQFAEQYPEIEDADEGIYGREYFEPELAKVERRRRIYGCLLAEVEERVPDRGRLLDVGTGDGIVLRVARDRGWAAEGTDIASTMVRHLRETEGLTVHHGALEDVDLPAGAFDAIVIHHVLEHTENPFRTLETIARLLRPGGVVRVEVPNLAGLSARVKNFQSRHRLKRKPWVHYATGHHFWYFTPPTLRHALETSGFVDIELRAPKQQWGDMSAATRILNPLYAHWRLGGHLAAFARKP